MQVQPQGQFKFKSLFFILLAVTFFVTTSFIHLEDAEAKRRHRRAKHSRKAGGGGRNAARDAKTPSGVYALYENSSFGYAKCLPAPTENADKILDRNGIDTKGAKPVEKAALAKGIAQVERLLGGDPIPEPWRIKFRWVNQGGAWNSGLREKGWVWIKTAVSPTHGQLTGRMMHELGHRVGNSNGGQNYQAYQKYTSGQDCHISGYTYKNGNEEFADVFEAYVVNPAFLEKHCKQAYSFFKDILFKNDKTRLASCSDPESVLKADHIIADKDDEEEDDDHDHDEDSANVAESDAKEAEKVSDNSASEKQFRIPEIANVPVPEPLPYKSQERLIPDSKVGSGVQ